MNREEGNFVLNQQVEINAQEDQKSDSSMIYSDRQSLSFISKSKGGLLQNPDGTLQLMKPVQASDYKKIKDNLNYGINGDQDDNLSQDTSQLSLMSLPQNQVLLPLYSSPAHPFFIPLGSLPQFVDQFIDLYIRHNICFLLFLIVQLIVEGVFQYLTYKFREKTIKELQVVYDKLEVSQIESIFLFLFYTNILYLSVYYLIGFLASLKKSYNLLYYFSIISIVGLSLEIILSYINEFNIMIFFLRVIAYVYSKFLSHLLLQLLLLPR
ncbi:transmembrane protein, putative (macronuclear) [Tetrahymena thermophila SB210]|uniref:Transmembrane protein, putative n=1 Tax=Tetrahymena thermophila (strain SB210) TaxID=312017 RepID=W7X167_TETTS|nr:transmembrane protein, putative [Tetrahymena thermophila SB210]EWS72955.1 transmembrane protein, putative [Tetrahymena thermophila SB210]|eukprot:XP_012654522.1 transmembrane protein, putative [Tetrahymena thermophila SB210]